MKDKNYYDDELLMRQEIETHRHAPSAETVAIHNMELDTLNKAMKELSAEDRELIEALFFNDVSKRTYMQKHNLTRKELNKKLNDVYAKLRAAVINI